MNARLPGVDQPQLAVRFAAVGGGRTYVAHQRATHPFHVGRALYRSADPAGHCTLFSQGCSGGLFEGDRVSASLVAGAGTRALVTTAAATIVHRMPRGGHAEQRVRIVAEPGALFEYVPEPAILFPASRLRSQLCLQLGPGARVVVIESVLQHGLPDDSEPFAWLESELTIEDPVGRLIARERSSVQGSLWRSSAPGLGGEYTCQGNVFVLGAGEAPLAPLRTLLDTLPGIYGGATLLPGRAGVLARVLAVDGVALRAALSACHSRARLAFGLPAPGPRPK
ncbi:MAG TPA: urease accessory protein UreD [Polyangiaceae bacterium]